MIFTCRNNLTMGSVLFTSVRNAGRPHLFLFLISSLLLLVTGCEVAETDSAGNSTGGFTSLGNQRYFANEVALTVETSTEPLPQQSVRGQFRPEEVRQRVKTPTGDKEVPLDGDGVNNLIAYAPIDLEKSNFGPVYNLDLIPTSGNSFGSSSGSRTLVWTVPEYDPETDPVLFTAFGKSGVLTGRSVTIQEQWRFSNYDKLNPDDNDEEPTEKDPPVVTVQISGVDFEDGSSSFGGRVQYLFSSTIPGLHTVENHVVHSDGAEGDGSWSYYQRRMEFAEEFPAYDDSTTDPVEIQNTIQWDDGTPVDDAEWEVEVGDKRKQGTGSEILAIWKPLEDVLEQYVDPATLPVEETLERVELLVKANAPVFTDQWNRIGPVHYTINGGTDVPRRPVLKIMNEQIEPTEPFTEGNNYANVLADIIYFDPEIISDDINWQADIKNSAGEAVWENMATGNGTQIAAQWDGTLNGAPLPPDDSDPTTYVFGLSAFLCDDGGGVVVTGRALEGVSAQVLGDESCTPDPRRLAQLDVPTNGKTAQIRFFDSTDTEITEMQPSYVFQVRQIANIVNRGGSDPGTQPTERVVPDIGANVVRVEILFNKERPQNEGYLLTVETASGGMRDGGHLHDNPAPPGVVSDTKSDLLKDLDKLTSAQKARIGDQGVAIEGKEEYTFIVRKGQKEVTLFYLAPISSNYRRFTLTRRTDSRKFGDKVLIVGIDGLVPLATTLAAKNIPYVEDPVREPYPEEPPGGILLTGKKENIHHQNLNGTPDFNNRLAKLAEIWIKNEKQRTLRFNDMSLPEGGKFSIDGIYELREKHTEHRVGENIDTNTDIIREKNRDPKFEDYIDQAGLAVYLELEDIHYHLRYLHEE